MKKYIWVLLSVLMWMSFLPEEASAHGYNIWGGLPLEIGVGVDDFLIENHLSQLNYRMNNIGPMFSVSAGFQIAIFSLSLDQEFGYVDLTYPSDGPFLVETEREKLFKGGTFISLGAGYPMPESPFGVMPKFKFGLGSVYMSNPRYLGGMSGWFAMRFGAGVDFWFSKGSYALAKLGLIFEYTLGISGPNDFDQRYISNFVGAKFVFAWADWDY